MFLKPEFRMGVDVVAGSGEFLLVAANAIEHGCCHDEPLGADRKIALLSV
jgi:hypothetical protein